MRALAYLYVCLFVVLSQAYLVVGRPMMMFLGSELSSGSASAPCASAEVLQSLAGEGMATAGKAQCAAISSSFTSIFMTYLGLYFIFLIQAVPPGVFLGSVAFVVKSWDERIMHGVADLATLCVVLAEMAVSCAVLGPFIIVYQMQAGTVRWWAALGILAGLRPALTLPLWRLVCRLNEQLVPICAILSLAALYVGLSMVGNWLLWREVGSGFSELKLQLSGMYVLVSHVTIVWFTALGAAVTLDDVAANSSANLCVVGRSLKSLSNWAWRRLPQTAFQHEEAQAENAMSLSGCGKAAMQQLWEKSWFLILWVLAMDAVVSLLYHVVKVLWLGFASGWFSYELRASLGVFQVRSVDQSFLAALPDLSFVDPVTWPLGFLLALFCAVLGWLLLIWVETGSKRRCLDVARCRLRSRLSWLCRLRQGTNDELIVALLQSWGPVESRAVTNFSQMCYGVVPTDLRCLSEVRQSWAGVAGWASADVGAASSTYRAEFLVLGTAHATLAFIRGRMARDGMPSAWGIMRTDTTKSWGLQQFRKYVGVAVDHPSVFDDPFLAYDWHTSVADLLQGLSLCCFWASVCFLKHRAASRCCAFAGGALGVSSVVSVLVPNYAALSNVPTYFTGCAKQFDATATIVSTSVMGMLCASMLGLEVFGFLVSIPISVLRGVWLLLIRKDARNVVTQRVLRGLMWLLAFLIPFVTVFPLAFFNQLTEDVPSQQILTSFWLLPSFFIVPCNDEAHETWFYFLWLCIYISLLGSFIWQQQARLNIDLGQALRLLDLPWLWSILHADFCLSNVLITDLILLVLDDLASPCCPVTPTPAEALKPC